MFTHPHEKDLNRSTPSPHARRFASEQSGKSYTTDTLDDLRRPGLQRMPNLNSDTANGFAPHRRHITCIRKPYGLLTPSGSSRASSPSQATEGGKVPYPDHCGPDSWCYPPSKTSAIRREQNPTYNTVSIFAPVARVASSSSRPHPNPPVGLGLDVADAPGNIIQRLHRLAQEELDQKREETESHCSVSSPPQSRYSARLRGIAPPPLMFPLPFVDGLTHNKDEDEGENDMVTSSPARARFTSGRASGNGDQPNRAAPIYSVIDAMDIDLLSAPLPTGFSPMLRGAPPSGSGATRLVPQSHSSANPPPLPRFVLRELPPISPLIWEQQSVAYDPRSAGMVSVDDMNDVPITAYNGMGTSQDPLSVNNPARLIAPSRAPPTDAPGMLSPLDLQYSQWPQNLEGHVERCYRAVDFILHSLATSRLHAEEVESLCAALKRRLSDIWTALRSAPRDLDLMDEEVGRQWMQKYWRVLDSLFRTLSYLDLLEQQLERHPPRLHKVDGHIEKLWQYVAKFQDLFDRLEHYHERLPLLQLKLRFTAMHKTAREELSSERQRRREWKAQWEAERQHRRNLREEIRRVRGPSRQP